MVRRLTPKNRPTTKTHWIPVITLLMLCTVSFSATKPVAVVSKIVGDLKIDMVSDPGWKPATWGGKLFNGDKLQTGIESFGAILFLDRSQIKIRENTVFTIKSKKVAKRKFDTELNISVGEMWLKTTEGSTFRIQTPTSVASVKGTELNIQVAEDGSTILTVLEGSVEFLNEMGKILATEMTTSIAKVNAAPTPPKSVPPKEIPVWEKKVKENYRLKLSPDKPGRKEVEKPFNLLINVQSIETGKTALDYNEEVTVSSGGKAFMFSVDGGQTWVSEAVIKINKGKGILKGKGSELGKTTLTVSGKRASPGKLEITLSRSRKAMAEIKTKATRALEKADPRLAEKLAGREMKASRVSKGVGTIESVFDKVDSGEFEITSKEIIENPDGSIRVIMRVKPVQSGSQSQTGDGN